MITIQKFFPKKSRRLNVELRDDIVNTASIGNEILVIGTLELVKKPERKFFNRIFDFSIEANNIEII